jgi:hypothetical protein
VILSTDFKFTFDHRFRQRETFYIDGRVINDKLR